MDDGFKIGGQGKSQNWRPGWQIWNHSSTAHVNCVAFHPVFSSLASGSDDCTIKIWDWELGELERTIKAHTQAVRDLDFGGPKGAVFLASCSSDLVIKIWDPSDNYNNIRTLSGHEHTITSVRFLPYSGSGKNLLDFVSKFCRDTTTGCDLLFMGYSFMQSRSDPDIDWPQQGD
ncbi:hypothetical protein MY3296_009908 [Beauveria thailandica]